jgi:hypothetical protein
MGMAAWVVAWMERRSEQFPPAAHKALKAVGGGPIGAGKVPKGKGDG